MPWDTSWVMSYWALLAYEYKSLRAKGRNKIELGKTKVTMETLPTGVERRLRRTKKFVDLALRNRERDSIHGNSTWYRSVSFSH